MEGLATTWVFLPILSCGALAPMMQLSPQEDWVDNVLLEWSAALELHQRGRVSSILPLLVGDDSGDFFADAAAAFGGTAALPTHTPTATLERATTHLQDTTSDPSLDNLRELVAKATGSSEISVQAVVNSVLKYQGVKIGRGEGTGGPMHGHGHISGGSAEDLGECVQRIQATVSSCLKKIAMEEQMTSTSADKTPRQSLMSRFSPRTPSSSERGGRSKLQGMRQALGGIGRSSGTSLDDSILSFDKLGDATVALDLDGGSLSTQAAATDEDAHYDDESFPGQTPQMVRQQGDATEPQSDSSSGGGGGGGGGGAMADGSTAGVPVYAQED
jgi:hypothetical protein